MKLMIFILSNADLLNFLLEDFSKAGIKGATIINSAGMGMTLSKLENNFLGSSLRALFDSNGDENKTILCVLKDEQIATAKQVIEDVVGDLSKPNTGIFFTLPIGDIDGLMVPEYPKSDCTCYK